MSIIRFPRALHRAIYVKHGRHGWFCYVAGYRPAARDTPKVTPRCYETFEAAMVRARTLSRRCGLPVVEGTARPPAGPGWAA